jgi:biotin operon repressor
MKQIQKLKQAGFYLFPDQCNEKKLFWFERRLIENGYWARAPAAAAGVFPVCGCFKNQKGWLYQTQTNLGILSGLSENTVRKGMEYLQNEWVEIFRQTLRYKTKTDNWAYKYQIELPNSNKEDCFPFRRFILESGSWANISPTAHKLYPVMKSTARFTIEIYNEIEATDYDESDFQILFDQRQYDVCQMKKKGLAELAGISRYNMNDALESLRKNNLIEPIDEKSWRVFLRTKDNIIYSRRMLNIRIWQKYRKKIWNS